METLDPEGDNRENPIQSGTGCRPLIRLHQQQQPATAGQNHRGRALEFTHHRGLSGRHTASLSISSSRVAGQGGPGVVGLLQLLDL